MLELRSRLSAACAAIVLAIAPAYAGDPERAPKCLDRYLPGAFLYFGIDDLKAFGSGCQKLALGRLMDAETFEQLVQEIVKATVGGDAQVKIDFTSILNSPEMQGLVPNPEELGSILSNLSGSVGFALVDPKGFGPATPSLAVGVELGELGPRVEAWLGDALQHFADQGFIELKVERTKDAVIWKFQDAEDPEPISVALRDGYLFLANEDALVTTFLAGGPEHPLAEQASYRAARAELDPRSGIFAWCDLGPAKQAIAKEGEQAALALRALGLDRMSWAGIAVRPEGESMLYRVRVAVEGGIAPLRRAFGTKTSYAALELAPSNSIGFIGLHLEPGGLLAAAREVLQAVPADERPNLDELKQQLESQLGLKLEQDVLAELGGEISVFVVPTAANLPVPSVVVAVELREEASADRLVAHAERVLGQSFPVQTVGKGRLYRLPEALRQPEADFESFAVLGRWALFAAPVPSARPTPALRRILNGESGGSLAQQPGFAKATGATSFGRNGGTLLYYLDWPMLAERVYPTVRAAVPTFLENEALAELLPTMEAVRSALVPAAGLLRVDERGLWFESCSVF